MTVGIQLNKYNQSIYEWLIAEGLCEYTPSGDQMLNIFIPSSYNLTWRGMNYQNRPSLTELPMHISSQSTSILT